MRTGIQAMLFSCLLPLLTSAEGTKQIAPSSGDSARLCLDRYRNPFAFFDASADYRLHIRIASLSERIFFGLGSIIAKESSQGVQFQVRDPGGNIILGPSPIPSSGTGYISGYDQDTIGPFPSSGGYDPIRIFPTTTGDYSLEFYYPPDQGATYSMSSYVRFRYFDIAVIGTGNREIPGRIWSRSWQFNCGLVQTPPTQSRFHGTMYILSDDSIVTSVNCNGFVGGTFTISSNPTGCAATGDISTDRQSRTGFHTYPRYRLFLSPPDSLEFPTGKANPGLIQPFQVYPHCETGNVELGIKVTMDGILEVHLEADTSPGANPRDVKLTANVLANPGGNGYNLIHWNGIDGLGTPVPNGTRVTATIRFIHGITHLPLYDIEYNDNGYIVEVIRPAGTKPDIYWDDSQLPGITTVNLTGCSDVIGCHLWDMETGDTNTVNSWWYVASSIAPSVTFTLMRSPGPPGNITGDDEFCLGGLDRSYITPGSSNATAYTWSFSGSGAILNPGDTSVWIHFDSTATSGTLSVSGYNAECGSGPAAGLAISFYGLPQVSLTGPDSICYNEPPFILAGGLPAGGDYLVDGAVSGVFDPSAAGAGDHVLIYRYTDIHGCSNSDTSLIFVRQGRECEIVLWVPNAFTPDQDGLNDTFRPFVKNVRNYMLEIFNRSGTRLFITSDPERGWDGTFQGRLCPEGTYTYMLRYLTTLSPPDESIRTGTIVLVR